jgi:glycosyltransferase involved in cell wall biosynthesis
LNKDRNKKVIKDQVSIIIPTYNHGNYIGKCIESIICQTYNNWEAIIVNNNSTDNTIEIIKNFNDNRISVLNINNQGIIAKSRNIGIQHAKGDYIAFLDSDDWWYSNKLDVIMSKKEDADFIYHHLDIYRNDKKTNKKHRVRPLKTPVFEDLMINANAITNSSVVVKKNILLKAGSLSEDVELKAVEDYDLWLKISRVTNSFLLIPEYLGGYLISGSNSSNISLEMIDKIDAVYNKNVNYLNKKLKIQAYYTKEYTIGRYLFNLGSYSKALNSFLRSRLSNSFEFKTKSYLMILLSIILKLIKGETKLK